MHSNGIHYIKIVKLHYLCIFKSNCMNFIIIVEANETYIFRNNYHKAPYNNYYTKHSSYYVPVDDYTLHTNDSIYYHHKLKPSYTINNRSKAEISTTLSSAFP